MVCNLGQSELPSNFICAAKGNDLWFKRDRVLCKISSSTSLSSSSSISRVISTESLNDNIDNLELLDAPAVIASIDSLFDMMTNLKIPKTHCRHHEHIRILTELNVLDLVKSVLKELIDDAPEQQKVLLNSLDYLSRTFLRNG